MSFLDFHLQALAKKFESRIKDTTHFFEKIKELGSLRKNAVLFTVDAMGLCPNVPNKEGLKKNVKDVKECKKCKRPYVSKAQANFCMRLNNYKSIHKSFKTKKPGA